MSRIIQGDFENVVVLAGRALEGETERESKARALCPARPQVF